METLTARLNAVQEQQLRLYESGKNDLETQIHHWDLLRQEYLLHHYGRKHGCTSLGHQSLMSLQASQVKAKEAIGMGLHLKALQQSQYGKETWTFSDTSLELWNAPPKYCFKKGGKTLEVFFDGCVDNSMLYTAWTAIYYETDTGWQKTLGLVDHKGLYYYDGDVRRDYVLFEQEAKKYGTTGVWEVRTETDVFCHVDSVSSTTGGPCGGDSAPEWPEQQFSEVLLRSECPANERRRQGQSAEAFTTSTPVCNSKYKRRRLGAGAKVLQPSRRRQQKGFFRQQRRQPESECGSRRRRGSSTEPVPILTVTDAPRVSWERQQRVAEPEDHPSSGEEEEELPIDNLQQPNNQQHPVVPANSNQQASQPPDSHLQQRRRNPLYIPADHCCDLPIVILRGDPNSLKCLRYRLTRQYRRFFKDCTKTFSWIGAGNAVGRGRIMLAFDNREQRNVFLTTVPLPPTVSVAWGRISSL